jgi:hypothetical protein
MSGEAGGTLKIVAFSPRFSGARWYALTVRQGLFTKIIMNGG